MGLDYMKLKLPDPKLTLKEAMQIIKSEGPLFDRVYQDIFTALARKGVELVNEKSVPRPLWEWLLDYFFTKVRPHIMPVMVRSYTRFKTLADSPMYQAVEMGKSGPRSSRISPGCSP